MNPKNKKSYKETAETIFFDLLFLLAVLTTIWIVSITVF